MCGANCPCGRCGAREAAHYRRQDEAVDAIPDVVSANIDAFVRETISEAYDAVGYEGNTKDEDFRRITLEAMIVAVNKRLREVMGAK